MIGDYDDEGRPVCTENLLGNSGAAHNVSQDQAGKSAVQLLREVVAEVTNNRIPAPIRKGPGFY